ncbi:hypothetical protein NLJ89_g11704 [Agrocybe chaxingu]|uniref:Uncharacterized protein n=1 Tax=Agrocybe chaxingu TaxID=84603 RepID=A0A9W8JRV4_9AGAR|nr:hypothetical protein NLJ89_g11704 [Agrocybe chaxingu]
MREQRDYYPVAESMLRAILPRLTPRSSHTRKTGSSKRKEKLPVAARHTPPTSVASSSKPTGSKRKARERQDSIETSHQVAPVEEVKRRRLAPPIALPSSNIHVKHRAEVVIPRLPPSTSRSRPEPPQLTPTPVSDTDFVPPKIKTLPPSQIATRHTVKKQAETKARSSMPDIKIGDKPPVASARGSGMTGRGRGRGGKILGSSRLIPAGGIRTSDSTPIVPTPLDGQELLDAISEHPEQVLMPRPCGNCIQRGKAAECRFLGSNKPCPQCASRKSGHCSFTLGTVGRMHENESSVLHHRLSVTNLRRLVHLRERDLSIAHSLRRQVKALYESAETCSHEISGILVKLTAQEPVGDFGRAYLTNPALEDDLRLRIAALVDAEAAQVENESGTSLHALEQVLPRSTIPGAPDPFASTSNAGAPHLQESQDVDAAPHDDDDGEQSPEEGS